MADLRKTPHAGSVVVDVLFGAVEFGEIVDWKLYKPVGSFGQDMSFDT